MASSPGGCWRRARASARRLVFGSVSLAALVCAGYLAFKLPIGNRTASPRASQPLGSTVQQSGARTNPKDGLSYIRIGPGEFHMGATPGNAEAFENEKRHRVRTTKAFWLSATPVTVAAYKRFVGEGRSSKCRMPRALILIGASRTLR